MARAYSVDEVFAIAEQIERNGARFYKRAAELAKDPAVKKVLAQLAEWEVGHEHTFADMRARAAMAVSQGRWDPSDEAEAYLQVLAGEYVFKADNHPADTITGDESPADVFAMAIGLENDAILFYSGLRGVMSDPTERALIDGLVVEEQSHVVYLNEQRAALAKPA